MTAATLNAEHGPVGENRLDKSPPCCQGRAGSARGTNGATLSTARCGVLCSRNGADIDPSPGARGQVQLSGPQHAGTRAFPSPTRS